QRCVPPSPLVLGRKPLKSPPPAADRDRPVSRIKSLVTKCMDYTITLFAPQGADVLAAFATPLRRGASLYGVITDHEFLHYSLKSNGASLGVVEGLVLVDESNQCQEALFRLHLLFSVEDLNK